MSPLPTGLARVTRAAPCRICGKPDWCLRSADGERAICARVESDRRAGEAGWLHVSDGLRRSSFQRPSVRIDPQGRDFGPYAAQAAGFRRSDGSDGLGAISTQLGLSMVSLRRLQVGWDGWAWTFPMSDAAGRIIGIRLRRPDGSKLSLKGSHEGLFIPQNIDPAGRLLLPEGPTDTAAALDLGLDAIGRPSCTGGVRLLVRLVGQRKFREVVVVADADEPGRRGARLLASSLAPYVPTRIVEPPEGVKDLRAWLRAGARHADVVRAIEASAVVRPNLTVTP